MTVNMMKLAKFLDWSVTGDGYVGYATHNKNAFFAIERSPKHKDYIDVVANKFVGLQDCAVRVSEYTRKDNGKTVVALRTTSHPVFTRTRERMYANNRRVIDPHQLTTLDWEAAAFLYMDDGSLCRNTKGSLITRLSTCAYTYGEQLLLRKAFIEKLGIVWNVNKSGRNLWQLNLAKSSRDAWFDGIRPFIVPSYLYKLPEQLQEGTPRTGDDLVCLS